MTNKVFTLIVAALIVLVPVLVRLPSASTQVREYQAFQINQDEQREIEIQRLRAIVRNETMQNSNPEVYVNAINGLGRLEAQAAIEDLVQLLTFRRKFEWENENDFVDIQIRSVTRAERYPAIGALALIGEASLPALTEVIASSENNPLKSQNAVETILSIFRYSVRAEKLLREAAITAPTPERRTRLLNALEKAQQVRTTIKQLNCDGQDLI